MAETCSTGATLANALGELEALDASCKIKEMLGLVENPNWSMYVER